VYKYKPEEEGMNVEDIAVKLTVIMLETLKEPDENLNLSFKITDFRNISIDDIEFVDGKNLPYYYAYWHAWPKAEIAYTGTYGLLGESNGTEYFNSEDMDFDRGIGRVAIIDMGGYYALTSDIKKLTTIRSYFAKRSYRFTPKDTNMPIEDIATQLTELLLDDLKLPDSSRSFQITDYRNIVIQNIQWYEDRQCWTAWPKADIAYIGRYGELGKSDGTQFFEYLGTDGGIDRVKIKKDGDTYTMTHLGDMDP